VPRQRRNGEGGIYYEAGRGRWRVDITLPDGQSKYIGRFKSEKDALSAKKVALRDAERGAIATGPRRTVEQFLALWLEDVVRPNRSVRTFQTYEEKVRLHVVPEIGKLALTSLTPQRLARLYAKKRETLSPATVQLIHGVIYGALKQAKRWGLVGTNVAELVERPPRPRLGGEERAFTAEQARALLRVMRGHKFESFWVLLLNTGLRFGEAAALRWADVDLENGVLWVRRTVTRVPKQEGSYRFTPPKSQSSRRTVPLNTPAMNAFVAQRGLVEAMRSRAANWAEPGLVFCNAAGRPLREDHVLAAFHNICGKAGLPRKRLHDLRHSAATLAHANGADLHDLKNLLGHSRIDMTSHIYTGYSVERVREAVDTLGSLFSVPSPEEAAPKHGLRHARAKSANGREIEEG